jgi:hypothetical protein
LLIRFSGGRAAKEPELEGHFTGKEDGEVFQVFNGLLN